MNALIQERTTEAAKAWVFYDGECPLCTGAAARFAPLLRRHHFDLAPLQTPWVQKRLVFEPDGTLDEMKLLAENGRIYGGADAPPQIARKIWWAWPLFAISHLPGVKHCCTQGTGKLPRDGTAPVIHAKFTGAGILFWTGFPCFSCLPQRGF